MKRRHNLCFWMTLLCVVMATWSGWRWYSGSESAAFSLAVNLIGVGICWFFAIKVRAINRDIAAIEEETEKIKAARARFRTGQS